MNNVMTINWIMRNSLLSFSLLRSDSVAVLVQDSNQH